MYKKDKNNDNNEETNNDNNEETNNDNNEETNKVNDGANKINLIKSTKQILYGELELKDEAPLTYAIEILTKTKKINHLVSFGGMIFTATTTLLMMLSASKLLSGQLDLSTNIRIKNMHPLNIILIGVLLLFVTNITIEKSTIIANICIILLMIIVSYAVVKIRHKLL
jgi:hypothetical protein